MPEWIKILAAGLVVGLIAKGATGGIQDDVIASCIAYNADQGREGASTNAFCICTAERTASRANIVHKLGYRAGFFDLSSPYAFGKKFGEETVKVCNALS